MSGNTYSQDLRRLYTDEDLADDSSVYIFCPMHVDKRRPSMRVYYDGAKCFTCGAYLSRKKLIADVDEREPWRLTAVKIGGVGRSKPSRPVLRLEEIRTLARMAHDSLLKSHQDYLAKRGLSGATIERYQLGHYGLGYTIPVFNEIGEVVTIKFRRDDSMVSLEDAITPKYWGIRGHNTPQVYPWPVTPGESVVLLEGEFDALLLRQHGVNAYSLTSGAASWNKITETTFPSRTMVSVLYDNDAAGEAAASELSGHLTRMGYTYVDSGLLVPAPYKDVTELWQHDPHEFHQLVWSYSWTQPTSPPLAASHT